MRAFPLRPARGLLSLFAFVVVTGGVLAWLRAVGGPAGFAARYGLLAPALLVPAQALVKVTPVGELLPWATANGMLYGVPAGAAMTWLAWMAASVIQYAAARHTVRRVDVAAHLARLPRWLTRFPTSHPVFLITVRWLPFGSPLVNAGAAVLGVPPGRLLWCAAVGYLPEALLYAALGAGLVAWV